MKTNTLSILNKIKGDSLMRQADSAESLCYYLEKYYKITLSIPDVAPLFKAMQTINEKIKIKRRADKLAAETVTT